MKKRTHKKLLIALLVMQSVAIYARVERIDLVDERRLAYDTRVAAAFYQTLAQAFIDVIDLNPDEQNIADYAGSFSKSFDHNTETSAPSAAGQAAFVQLVKAVHSGLQADFNLIERAEGATAQLKCPQASLAFSMQGRDSCLMLADAPPTLDSAWAAAEILELYWMELCRDVKFSDYGTGTGSDDDGLGGSITTQAAYVLTDLGSA